MSEKMKKEEITLSEVIDNVFLNYYRFFAKRYKMLISFFVFGLLVGVLFLVFKGNTYVTKIVASSNTGNYYEVNEIINSLTPLSQNKKKLSEVLNISVDEVSNIRKISSDTTFNQLIEIEIIYVKELNYSIIEQKLVEFVSKNDYLARDVSSQKKEKEALKEQLRSEIDELDSLQDIILFNLKNEDPSKTNEKIIIKNEKVDFYHNDILYRKKEIFKADSILMRLKALDVIKPSSQVPISYYSTPIVLIGFTFLFSIFGVVVAAFFNFKERLI